MRGGERGKGGTEKKFDATREWGEADERRNCRKSGICTEGRDN